MAEYPHILSRNLLQEATTTSSNVAEDSVYRLAYLTDRSRQSQWRGVTGTAEQAVTWDFGTATELDTFVLDKGFTLTGSVTVYFRHSTDNANWTDVVTLSSPTTTEIYWRTFTAVSKRYWQLRITGLTAAPRIYNVWGGSRIELTQGPMGEFDPDEKEVVGDSVTGGSGGYQYSYRYSRRVLRANFENITDTQYADFQQWKTEAADTAKNFWWLTYPTTRAANPTTSTYYPIFLNTAGGSVRFPIVNSTRHGAIEAHEVL